MELMDWFTRWLSAQRKLQVDVYDVEPEAADADYVHAMITGLFAEVGELAGEIDWKYWSKGRGNYDRQRVIDEAVDVLHFLGNILLWAGVDGQELTRAYIAKLKENERRQVEGYDASLPKCIVCGLSLIAGEHENADHSPIVPEMTVT